MTRILKYLGMIIFVSCTANDQNHNSDFVDKILDVAIETSNEQYVELPDLYDSLASDIPDDAQESLKLVQRLKAKGFEVVNWGRGNNPPLAARIVTFEMRKDNCYCSVDKRYYFTTTDGVYQMSEGISCKKK